MGSDCDLPAQNQQEKGSAAPALQLLSSSLREEGPLANNRADERHMAKEQRGSSLAWASLERGRKRRRQTARKSEQRTGRRQTQIKVCIQQENEGNVRRIVSQHSNASACACAHGTTFSTCTKNDHRRRHLHLKRESHTLGERHHGDEYKQIFSRGKRVEEE